MTEGDAAWLNSLFNDATVVRNLEGVKLFNQNLDRTRLFIRSLNMSTGSGKGMLWAIEYQGTEIGFVSVYDLPDTPFFSYALHESYRGKGLFSGIVHSIERYLQAHS